MVTSSAATVDQYLDELDDDRRAFVSAIRDTVNEHLPAGYQEGMQWGMIGWFVPHALYPPGYHTDGSQPLPLAGLASQRRYVSLYLLGLYCGCADPGSGIELTPDARWFHEAWASTGRALDMGKSCVRMRRPEDAALDVIGQAIARIPVETYVGRYEETLSR